MVETVPSNDVFDGNAETIHPLSARVLGHFARIGADAWDPYAFVAESGEMFDLLPGVEVHREGSEACFRLRLQGRVVRAQWVPSAAEAVELADDEARQRYFATKLTRDFASAPALGGAAVRRNYPKACVHLWECRIRPI
jgi:hypothetical protein